MFTFIHDTQVLLLLPHSLPHPRARALISYRAGLDEDGEERLSGVINLLVSKGICSIPECAAYNSERAEAAEDFFEWKE